MGQFLGSEWVLKSKIWVGLAQIDSILDGLKQPYLERTFPSPNPLLMYIANVKDIENAYRWLAALSSSIVH